MARNERPATLSPAVIWVVLACSLVRPSRLPSPVMRCNADGIVERQPPSNHGTDPESRLRSSIVDHTTNPLRHLLRRQLLYHALQTSLKEHPERNNELVLCVQYQNHIAAFLKPISPIVR